MQASLQKKSHLTRCSTLKLTNKIYFFLTGEFASITEEQIFSLTSCIIEQSDSLAFVLIFVILHFIFVSCNTESKKKKMYISFLKDNPKTLLKVTGITFY